MALRSIGSWVGSIMDSPWEVSIAQAGTGVLPPMKSVNSLPTRIACTHSKEGIAWDYIDLEYQ
ncbi:MAG: hypothetical protein A2V81_03920 [Candidatus Abawacabacteria bacterium RBG_16_42_10]|uniref:Uncharacterized protein n=1 Tax=Candidatus Abawacabacteria bacterium RBG_16_42_10 TaxID=1817814 RepID=A0A1F4XIY8_9BACT|nr:MAG: hypothetical protein A2V81_03920 [Candidatus Abawacabacteria bacterium RBG_16_42_10]